jgi:hypothetical protein
LFCVCLLLLLAVLPASHSSPKDMIGNSSLSLEAPRYGGPVPWMVALDALSPFGGSLRVPRRRGDARGADGLCRVPLCPEYWSFGRHRRTCGTVARQAALRRASPRPLSAPRLSLHVPVCVTVPARAPWRVRSGRQGEGCRRRSRRATGTRLRRLNGERMRMKML